MGRQFVVFENGQPKWVELDDWKDLEAILGKKPEEPEQPETEVLFEDDFTELSLGEQYNDHFIKWNTRHLNKYPNYSRSWWEYHQGQYKTHEITKDGLLLQAFPDKSSPTGARGGFISTEGKFEFTYGKVELWYSLPGFDKNSGIHNTFWLMPANGTTTEYDVEENITNNHEGRLIASFRNAKNSKVSYWDMDSHPTGWYDKVTKRTFIWSPKGLEWYLDDKLVHTAPNLYDEPMYLIFSQEYGENFNGQFPGGFLPGTVWPSKALLRRLRVSRLPA